MDLKRLRYFVCVSELGSFTLAARHLGIAQPALSRQVRLLEVELRQSLLTRNGRGATPTEAGKLLLAHGRGILHVPADVKLARFIEHKDNNGDWAAFLAFQTIHNWRYR